jgi:predicted AAA+ superfamily ATPase
MPDHKTLYDAAAINRKTAVAYDQLLANLFVLDKVPAWASNRLTRLVRAPKRYLIDPSLVGGALGLDVPAVMRDGDLLGRLLDTFVAAQLRPELELETHRPEQHHLREKDGRREIDLVIESPTATSSRSRSKRPQHRPLETPGTSHGAGTRSASASSPAPCCTRDRGRSASPTAYSLSQSARCGPDHEPRRAPRGTQRTPPK